ncbi:VacJ family lipoprotein [Pseudoduganella sp. DS3]|uniref:VacJ family lipoprotein n=1 Tax=Pseudoduganella guangdongensis TaxID=2692179 RepID=A0A6N9HC26_9BURK|nr:VacJ family lipoprotein [Pseudoduganella guangdongensis]MYN01019.1 VacJ family lipoprotein [Pseudoduganella guangdongensis]
MSKFRTLTLAVSMAVALGGCATSGNPRDPFEGYNRAVFNFNDKVDEVALKPVATAYKNVTPGFFQTGVSNFFGNLADIWTAANNMLQGKVGDGMSDVMRVALNSTFGLLGVLDVASEAGLQKHKEDFGQTLGSWGVPSGPYLVLPLLGPSTVRDTAALPADIVADPWRYKDPVNVRTIGSVTRVVDQRASLLDASSLLEDAALDRYEFVRDGWMQRRNSQVYDGEDGPQGKQKQAEQEDEVKNPPQAIIAEPAEKTSSL